MLRGVVYAFEPGTQRGITLGAKVETRGVQRRYMLFWQQRSLVRCFNAPS